MENKTAKKRDTRKTLFGIKLPPITPNQDGDIKTIIDIDPHFYSLVEGRPIKSNKSLLKYKQNIKETALKRTLHGFIVDEALRIEKEIESERNIYDTTSKHFEEYQLSFDKFLAHDNDITIEVMKKSDNLNKELMNLTEEHKKASYEMASLRSNLKYIDETLQILLSFENFLHKASPILWQESNEVSLEEKKLEIIFMDSDIFTALDVNRVKDILNNLAPPRLYFTSPGQLLEVFETVEKQNLDYYLATEELTREKNGFFKKLEKLKALLKLELQFIEDKMKETEDLIKANELRETELKEVFHMILQDKLQALLSSNTVLKILNYVEFAYEHLISPNDTNLGYIEMTLALENEYENLMLDLSGFDLTMVKKIEKDTYDMGTKEIKLAQHANNLLKDVDKLTRRLKSSYEAPRKKLN